MTGSFAVSIRRLVEEVEAVCRGVSGTLTDREIAAELRKIANKLEADQ